VNDFAQYCRDIETYLCQKNGGHLVRIVGPAFEQVRSWAERGVPLKIAFSGIDKCCARHDAKGTRRRPVRIEFCEADILDAFDEWRRAVGAVAADEPAPDAAARRKPALAGHIERAAARLRALTPSGRSPAFLERLEAAARELDALAMEAPTARGDVRARIVDRLAALDRGLLAAAVEEVEADPARAAAMSREAEDELAPFRERMVPDARERALRAAYQRLVRAAIGVPVLAYE